MNDWRSLLFIVALVLFILAALFLFGVGDITIKTSFGLIAAGLACFAAATSVWPRP
jgi:hypothetical protein